MRQLLERGGIAAAALRGCWQFSSQRYEAIRFCAELTHTAVAAAVDLLAQQVPPLGGHGAFATDPLEEIT